MVKKLQTRVDDVWGKTIIIEPSFKVRGRNVEIMITERDVSVWIDDFEDGGDGPLTIINVLQYYGKRHKKFRK